MNTSTSTSERESIKSPLPLTTHGITLYQGSSQSRSYVPKILEILKEGILRGEDLRFRDISELYTAFEEKRCFYAINSKGHIAGFVFFNIYQLGAKKSFLCNSAFIVTPPYRNKGLGRIIKQNAFEITRRTYPNIDIISHSCNPAVTHLNTELGFKDISYDSMWEIYGFDIAQYCADCPNLKIDLKKNALSKNPYKNIHVIHIPTGLTFKQMAFFADQSQAGNLKKLV